MENFEISKGILKDPDGVYHLGVIKRTFKRPEFCFNNKKIVVTIIWLNRWDLFKSSSKKTITRQRVEVLYIQVAAP